MEEAVINGSAEISVDRNTLCSSENICGNELQDIVVENPQMDVLSSSASAAEVAACGKSLPAVYSQDSDANAELVTPADEKGCPNSDDKQCHSDESVINGEQKMQCNDAENSVVANRATDNEGNSLLPDEEKELEVTNAEGEHEQKLAMNQAREKFSAFHRLDRPASVVIDLRTPPLVQVCMLHGMDDAGAGASCSSGGTASVPRRPQTARRGRRQHSSMTGHIAGNANIVADTSATALSAADAEKVTSPPARDTENFTAAVSTIIHLKLVETPDEAVACDDVSCSRHDKLSPVTGKTVSDAQLRRSCRDANINSESSDDDLVMVRNVSRTYSRNSSDPTVRKNPRLIANAKSGNSFGRKMDPSISVQNAQEFKSVPKKFKKSRKSRTRIGPAWYSRQFLNAPPVGIQQCERTLKMVKTYKHPNYNSGTRRRPVVASPSTVKRQLSVLVAEESEVASVGREQLSLWKLSDEDVVELQSQLRQEAEHRRTEHIMPLVMQMTDAQIEHAYEHVTESMKTYEIVAADSDDDDMMEDDEEETAGNYDDSSLIGLSGWNDVSPEPIGETEYSRSRPKRHAVDYGPAAFTPILIMEGRRAFERKRKPSKESKIKSAERAERNTLMQRPPGHRSRRKVGRRSKASEQLAGKSIDDLEDTSGERVGLFDGLTQSRGDGDSATVIQQNAENDSLASKQILPLLIPAKHVAVISAVRSSPPPDLGQPMAPDGSEAATDPNGPPVLEPELAYDAGSCSDVAPAKLPVDAEASVPGSSSSVTLVPPLASDNGVVVID